MPEPGTYRTRTGLLVHCRRDPDGTARIEIEGGGPQPARAVDVDGIVKLSDDPLWPDRWDRVAAGRVAVD